MSVGQLGADTEFTLGTEENKENFSQDTASNREPPDHRRDMSARRRSISVWSPLTDVI
jgi:hypothetical protein